jgi:hypothetical protein
VQELASGLSSLRPEDIDKIRERVRIDRERRQAWIDEETICDGRIHRDRPLNPN